MLGTRKCFLGEGAGTQVEGRREEDCSGPCWWPGLPTGRVLCLGRGSAAGPAQHALFSTASQGPQTGQGAGVAKPSAPPASPGTAPATCSCCVRLLQRQQLRQRLHMPHKQETSTGPFTENICPHWLQTPFKPCCVSVGPTSISWGPELSGGHRTEPEVTGSTSGHLSA